LPSLAACGFSALAFSDWSIKPCWQAVSLLLPKAVAGSDRADSCVADYYQSLQTLQRNTPQIY